ncbi:hypothetical protein P691DRAFT_762094 [Macrolepiota fuliginosa MF-IS2]|uniref:Uncharacterized protein n=1 Tax=Macrolepiota fuliginosa MF-IS2 TaxID=1400762 RepID=A0A9P6BZW1_9AGAR|nr:hypothetical protein P691DRAFT_762094 [Macrolepiota fuliginosa MF-IS2]
MHTEPTQPSNISKVSNAPKPVMDQQFEFDFQRPMVDLLYYQLMTDGYLQLDSPLAQHACPRGLFSHLFHTMFTITLGPIPRTCLCPFTLGFKLLIQRRAILPTPTSTIKVTEGDEYNILEYFAIRPTFNPSHSSWVAFGLQELIMDYNPSTLKSLAGRI